MHDGDARGGEILKFAFPPELGLSRAVGSIPFIAFGAFMLWAGGSLARGPANPLGLSGPTHWSDSYFFLGGGLLAIAFGVHWAWSFIKFKDYVVVITPDTIAYARPRLGQRRSPLPWKEVAGLRFRPLLARLELLSPNAYAVFSVDSQVRSFGELLETVIARVPGTSRRLELPRTIRTRVTRRDIVMVVLCAVLVALGYAYVFRPMLLAVAVIATMYAIGRFFGLLAVTVTGDSVILSKGYRRISVPLSQLREVRVGVVRERGRATPCAGLIRTDGSQLNVSPESCDPFEVFDTVQSAIEGARARPS